MGALVFKGNEGQALTSSLLIAEKFGKEHRNVMQSIRNLTAENSAVKGMFVETTYLNDRNQEQPMYVMNRDGFTLLVMGFTGEKALQFKLDYIDAFNQMEKELKEGKVLSEPKQLKPMSENTLFNIRMKAISWAAKLLNMNEASKLEMVKAVTDPLGLPSPSYASSEGAIHSATYLLKEHGVKIETKDFNQRMFVAGLLEHKERPSKSKGVAKFWALSEKGLGFGENQVSPNNPRETQPLYFDNKFNELLKVINLGTV